MDKISVIIPTYNRAGYLVEAIKSCFLQEYPNIEVIVIDDGSIDNTKEILQPWLGKIKYFYQDNQGARFARNYGIRESNGNLIAFLDSDDIWLPNKLNEQIKYMQDHLEFGLVATQALHINTNGELISNTPTREDQLSGEVKWQKILLDSPLTLSTIIMRKECSNTFLPYELIDFYEDWEMCLRVASKFKVGYLAKPLSKTRVHRDQVTWMLTDQNIINNKLRNRLIVIDLAMKDLFFDEVKQDDQIRNITEAQEYARFCVPSYVNSEYDLAKSYFRKAVSKNPILWGKEDEWIKWFTYYSLLLEKTNDSSSDTFMHNSFSNLPNEIGAKFRKNIQQKTLSNVYFDRAFRYYHEGNYDLCVRNVTNCLLRNPAYLKNRGIISIYLRSILKKFFRLNETSKLLN